jgi:hypothetical protein
MFALTEAKALIIRHRDAVLAIANALMIHRTLDAVMIHRIVALAPERAQRYRCVLSLRTRRTNITAKRESRMASSIRASSDPDANCADLA